MSGLERHSSLEVWWLRHSPGTERPLGHMAGSVRGDQMAGSYLFYVWGKGWYGLLYS
jgi:hypothetical protein